VYQKGAEGTHGERNRRDEFWRAAKNENTYRVWRLSGLMDEVSAVKKGIRFRELDLKSGRQGREGQDNKLA